MCGTTFVTAPNAAAVNAMIRNRYQGTLQGGLPVGVTITMASLRSLAFHLSPLQIRPYEPADWPAIWALLEPVFRAGETFPHDPAITEDGARAAWVKQSQPPRAAAGAPFASCKAEPCKGEPAGNSRRA
jgi:hypothetical protein